MPCLGIIMKDPFFAKTNSFLQIDPRDIKNRVQRPPRLQKSSPAIPETSKIESSEPRDIKSRVQRSQRLQKSSPEISKIESSDSRDLKIESSDPRDIQNRVQRPQRSQKLSPTIPERSKIESRKFRNDHMMSFRSNFGTSLDRLDPLSRFGSFGSFASRYTYLDRLGGANIPQPATHNPQPATRILQPTTRNPKPATRKPQSANRKLDFVCLRRCMSHPRGWAPCDRSASDALHDVIADDFKARLNGYICFVRASIV